MAKKYKTKAERKAIYKKLLKGLNEPLRHGIWIGFFICWKLYFEVYGADGMDKLGGHFGKTDMIFDMFPEFKKGFNMYRFSTGGVLTQDQRKFALKYAIKLCDE